MPRRSKREESSESESESSSEVQVVPPKKRAFRCVDMHQEEKVGRYYSVSPIEAARKAFGKMCKRMEARGEKIPSKGMMVYIVETTKGSDRKIFAYKGRRYQADGRPTMVEHYYKDPVPSFDEDGNPPLDKLGNPVVNVDGEPFADEDGNPVPIRLPYINLHDSPPTCVEWKEVVEKKNGEKKRVKKKEIISNLAGESKLTMHRYRYDLISHGTIPDEVVTVARAKNVKVTSSEEDEASAEESPVVQRKEKKKSRRSKSKK